MITEILFQDYGPFKEAKLRLGPLTVLVGPNASGKTTAIEALDKIQTAGPGGVSPEYDAANRLRDLFRSMARRTSDASPVVELRSGDSLLHVVEDDHLIPFPVLLHLQPSALRSPSYISSPRPLIGQDGYGLPTVLAYIKLQDTSRFDLIEEAAKSIVPSFGHVRFQRVGIDQGEQVVYGDQLVFDMEHAEDLPPAVVSDGTLLALGLLASVVSHSAQHRENSKDLIFLVDELERGLHPRALDDLVKCLRSLTETTDVQILATSHSPYLLDWLKPDEVRLTGFLEDGSATIRELTDHPDFDRWKDEMTPGEFWSTVGEDWIR